jgi:outer membrane protein assembly factor BamB
MVMKMNPRIRLCLLVSSVLGLMMISLAYMIPLWDASSIEDWICFKGSPERRSSSDAPSPDTAFLEWVVDTHSELHASPVEKDGKVFQVALDRLLCISISTGKSLWISDIPVYESTPFLTGNKVIVATNRGISALSTDDGTPVWEYMVRGRFREELSLRDYIVSSPAVQDGKVVVGTMPYWYVPEEPPLGVPDEMYIVCLDEAKGKEQWYMETGLGIRTAPCIYGGKIFAASREMLCVDLEKGKILWNSENKYPWEINKPVKERYSFRRSTPALYHGILVAGSFDAQGKVTLGYYIQWQKIVFMDQYTGNILWEWVEEGALASSPAVYEGKIYLYSLDGMVRCLSFLEGRELWQTRISEPVEFEAEYFRLWPSPTVADGKVYIGSIEGVIYCLDAETGEVLWTYQTGGEIRSAPAIVDGKVLVSSTDGKLYCFGIDPDTYLSKAQKYLEEGEIEKAQQFLVKAKEYAKTEEEITGIENLLEIVDQKMPEYRERMEKLKKAESLMDEADKIMWDKKFKKAHDLYNEAYAIFQEVDDEFGKAFCMERMEYITQRMPEETTEIPYWLGILAVCGVIACLVVWRRRRSQE